MTALVSLILRVRAATAGDETAKASVVPSQGEHIQARRSPSTAYSMVSGQPLRRADRTAGGRIALQVAEREDAQFHGGQELTETAILPRVPPAKLPNADGSSASG